MGDEEISDNPDIVSFLKNNHIAVLATANKMTAVPHAAAIYYGTNSKLDVFFLSKESTTKSKNLADNPQATIVIYEATTQKTAQIYGPVEIVDDSNMMERVKSLMSKYSEETAGTSEIPLSKIDGGEYVLYKLTPQSVRLGEYKYGPKGDIFQTAVSPGTPLD